ncbi:MAG: PQQ-binding-like beta-propeller repeat protein, partial [bacterium]
PAILPGGNETITPDEYPASDSVEFASEDTFASSEILTITTYTGHQEAHLITFPDGTTMSIDCGYEYGDAETITTISHFHQDHCGDCGEFYPPYQYHRNNVIPGDVIYSDDDRNITVTVVAANGVVIGQEPAGPYDCGGYENHWSMALLVQYRGFDYLTGGDMDAAVEWPLGAALKERSMHIDVHKVSHHGSGTSTPIGFLLDILPEYAVIAGGGSAPTEETISSLVYAGVNRIYYAHSYPVYPGYPICVATTNVVIATDGYTYSISGGACGDGPIDVDSTPTPTTTPTITPTWDPSVPTYTPTATPTLRPEGPWPMFRYDAAGTGQSRYFIGPQTGRLAWSYETNGYVDSDPVVGFDGRVYVGSNDNNLYAVTSEGVLIWSYLTGHDVTSAPALNRDGVVHIGSCDDGFYAITSSGLLLWSHITGGDIRSSAVINSAGNIYVGADDNMIYAFSSDGYLEWSYETADNASSSPAVGNGGNVYTGSEGTVASSPAIRPDGSICVGSEEGRLYAFTSTGSFLWRYLTINNCSVASPVMDRSGNVYVGSTSGRLYGLTPSGKCSWSYGMNSVYSSAAIGFGGNIYIGAFDRNMYAFTSEGCLIWSYRTNLSVRSSTAIGYDGYVYVGSRDRRLYAFKDPYTP